MNYFLNQFAAKPLFEATSVPLAGTMPPTRTIEGAHQDNFRHAPPGQGFETILTYTMTIANTIEGHGQDRPRKNIFFM